jgi:hypothetical protein
VQNEKCKVKNEIKPKVVRCKEKATRGGEGRRKPKEK